MRPKNYRYLTDDSDKNKKGKAQKCVIKQKLKFGDYKNFLEANQLEKEINSLAKTKRLVDSL